MRKNKSKINTGKLAVLFIITAMALAGIGAGYSAWFDTITIEGEVSTGSVGWHFSDVSETFVYKIHDLPDPINPDWGSEIFVDYASTPFSDIVMMYEPYLVEEIASATVVLQDDHHAIVTYTNLFPCINFEADVWIDYTGTVPGKLNSITFNDFWASDDTETSYGDEVLIDQDTTLEVLVYDENEDLVSVPDDYLGLQLHEGYRIHIILTVHLEQNNDLMNLNGDFEVSAEVVQWNEFPYDGGDCDDDEPFIGHHADVMLCIDTSGSIGAAGEAQTVIDASKAFVTALLSPDDGQVGIVNFDDGAWLKSTFSTDVTALHDIIDGLSFTGPATNLAAGISLSQNELDTADRTLDVDYPDYMVIVTDGEPNTGGNGETEATAAKNAGTRIFVLGIGTIGSTLLESIASPGDYYDVVDFDALEAVLLSLVST